MNINQLTPEGVTFISDRLDGIAQALIGLDTDLQRGEAPVMERCERILPSDLFNELRAYIGSIRGHAEAIHSLLFDLPYLHALDGLVVDECAQAHADQAAAPLEVSDEVAQSRVVFVDDDASYTERWHPCVEHDCPKLVPFDDEPWCFTHSPDSGSSVRDYSWQRVNGISTIEHIERHHRLSAQFMRGLITSAEMQAALVVLVHDAQGVDAEGLPL